jgi:hypothetical protein
MYGKKRNAYVILVGMPAGGRPLGRLGRKREDYIKMDLTEIGWVCMDWIIWLRIGTSVSIKCLDTIE